MDIDNIKLYNQEYIKKEIKNIQKAFEYSDSILHNNMCKLNFQNINIPKTNILNFQFPKIEINSFNNVIKNSLENLNNAFQDVFGFDLQQIMEQQCQNFRNLMIENHRFLGNYGWGYYYIEEIDDDSYIKSISMPNELKEFIKENPDVKPIDIDEFISNYFPKKKLISIINKSKSWLDNDDILKLEQALKHYNAKRYYDSASILIGLIDAQNIKQELFDLKHEKYKEEFKTMKGDVCNIDQGWNAFSIVFRNNFSKYFNNELLFGKKTNIKSKEDLLNELVDNTKYDMDIDIGDEILCVAFPLIKFFDDNNWKNYPNKPTVINRNWLMHGMYSYDDITKYDCIKLFLMLYQLTNLFYKLQNNLLDKE